MLWPLLIMAVAFLALFIALHLMGMRNEILRRRVQTLGMRAARENA
jgi:heme exporter protein C